MKPRKPPRIVAVFLSLPIVVIAASVVGAAPQAVTLRWNFVEGQQLVYRMTTTQETELPGGSGVMVAENVMTTSWEVVQVSDAGAARVRITTDRVQMNVQTPMGNIAADSADETEAGDPIARSAVALAGVSYTMVFDATGQVQEISGLEATRESLREAMGQPGNPMVDQLLDQMASEDGLESMFGRGMATFPPEPLLPGDSWDASLDFNLPMLGTVTNTSIMTLEGVETRDGERIALIDAAGDMLFTPDETAGNPMAGAMRMGDAEISGGMEWSVDRGLLLVSTTRTMMEMEVTAGAQQMTVVTTIDARMELIDEGAVSVRRTGS